MFPSVAIKCTSWVMRNGRVVIGRRVFLDEWTTSATSQLAEYLEQELQKVRPGTNDNMATSGFVSLEIGVGTPEAMAKYIRGLKSNISDEELTKLLRGASEPQPKTTENGGK